MAERSKSAPKTRGSPEAASPPQAPDKTRQLRQAGDAPAMRTRLGLGAAAETAPAWGHAPRATARPGDAAPQRVEGIYRGRGPRGYVRPDQRIYEDICDRLTDNPFLDASDIEVIVRAGTVTLAGSVDNAIALRQAEEIAREIVGVAHVRNDLIVQPGDERAEETPGDRVNRAMGPPRRR